MPVFRPLDDQVLVRRPPAEGAQGKLLIPDRAQERPLVGEVLAVGPGRADRDGTRRSLSVRVGDQVMFSKYAGDEVQLDGADCLVLREADLLGVLDPDPEEVPCP
jgi:chaperonin GroES